MGPAAKSRSQSISKDDRPELSGLGTTWKTPVTIRYDEGAEVGYRWYAQKSWKPIYAFGYGLSYTTFEYKNLRGTGGETVTATFTVTNTGNVAGADAPQIYFVGRRGKQADAAARFRTLELAPGASKTTTVKADPRLLAQFDGTNGLGQWRIRDGSYRIAVGRSADDLVLAAEEDRVRKQLEGWLQKIIPLVVTLGEEIQALLGRRTRARVFWSTSLAMSSII